MGALPDFGQRSEQEEIMDDLQSSGFDLEQSLRELAFINKWSGGQEVLTNGLNKIKPELAKLNRPVKIIDLGCGGGDLLEHLAKWGKENQIPLSLEGIDANPNVIQFAKNWTNNEALAFQTEDIFSRQFEAKNFDVVLLTLFCHHFTTPTLVNLLKQLAKQASTAILINDLHRHPVPYYFTMGFTKLFSKTPMVKNDGPLSVMRAFKKQDWLSIMHDAGLSHFDIRWFWAFRWQVLINTHS